MKKLNYRYMARVILEAETPLFIGSGETSLLTDALVQKDNHGFPMIQGTSLSGVLRHGIEDKKSDEEKEVWKSFFGYQSPKGKKGLGSRLSVSSAYMILHKGMIAEGLKLSDAMKNYQPYFANLPVRQHVKITDKGVAKDNNLFDNEVVYKGAKFLFEIELNGTEDDKTKWFALIHELKSQRFRLGQGTRNGYGRLKVDALKTETFNLDNKQDFETYLNINPSLNSADLNPNKITENVINDDYTHYKLELKPDDFFIFSAGYGDDEVDNIPVTEYVLTYDENNTLNQLDLLEQTYIPASSIKGALSHRTAFHYNKLKKKWIDNIENEKYIQYLKTNNEAVYELFGAEEGNENRNGQRGRVIINDIFLASEIVSNDKIFNHVAIDRFTGGAMDGALFSEKVSYFNDKENTLDLNIYIENENYQEYVIEAFEEALKDVCKGLLPLGGMTTKGHGMFTGKLFRNETEFFSYE